MTSGMSLDLGWGEVFRGMPLRGRLWGLSFRLFRVVYLGISLWMHLGIVNGDVAGFEGSSIEACHCADLRCDVSEDVLGGLGNCRFLWWIVFRGRRCVASSRVALGMFLVGTCLRTYLLRLFPAVFRSVLGDVFGADFGSVYGNVFGYAFGHVFGNVSLAEYFGDGFGHVLRTCFAWIAFKGARLFSF